MLLKPPVPGAGQVVVVVLDWSRAKHHICRGGRLNTPVKQAGAITPIWARVALG